jgi:hypothetical protein
MHGKNEVEVLLRKPNGDCVEDLGADRRAILKLFGFSTNIVSWT